MPGKHIAHERKQHLTRFVCWAWIAFATIACFGQNLAQNPGFEAGNTAGWFGFGAVSVTAQAAIVHSGNYAALVQNRTASWNGVAQTFLNKIQPGQKYYISTWVRLASGSETLQMTMKRTEGGITQYAVVASDSASADRWTQLSGEYTLSSSGPLTDLTLYIEIPSNATVAYYADDLLVQPATTGPSGTDGESLLDWTHVHQRIDGFGASSAWRGNWTEALADMFFSTNSGTGTSRTGGTYPYTGIGLSLLRSRIAPGGTTVEQTIMQMAQARGAMIWSAPWSPEARFKSNGNVNGGSFVGHHENYQAYASQLAGYVSRMKTQYGIDLYALSIQNEPDANVTSYESCNWTPQQVHDFVPYLSSALSASNVGGTRIMLPESQNWTDPKGLRLPAMNNPSVAAMIGIIANHNYVPDNATGDQTPPAALANYGKALWQTEVAKLSGSDDSIEDGLYWATRVHQFLTVAQANAWHYWWLCAYGTSNEGLCDTNDVPARRMYTLGNFSRFVRPGFHRFNIAGTGTSLVSAYRNLTNGQFAIVAINRATNAVTQTFVLTNATCVSITPWITSSTKALSSQNPVPVAASRVDYSLPSQSVVTFTGVAGSTNTPPSLLPVADHTINAGAWLTITNTAMDPDLPRQSLSFTLLAGPTNATLNATTGVLTWRPLVAQANTTNLVHIEVADTGMPPLSDTNTFSVVVLPLAPPFLSSATSGDGQLVLCITGALGPDYGLLASTNLVYWEPALTTNPASMPLILSLTNHGYPRIFYKIQLGP